MMLERFLIVGIEFRIMLTLLNTEPSAPTWAVL